MSVLICDNLFTRDSACYSCASVSSYADIRLEHYRFSRNLIYIALLKNAMDGGWGGGVYTYTSHNTIKIIEIINLWAIDITGSRAVRHSELSRTMCRPRLVSRSERSKERRAKT